MCADPRMRTSSVLLYTLRGLATEIAKNVVLAGIGSISLLDAADVSPTDLGANFFLREDDVGSKVRRALVCSGGAGVDSGWDRGPKLPHRGSRRLTRA